MSAERKGAERSQRQIRLHCQLRQYFLSAGEKMFVILILKKLLFVLVNSFTFSPPEFSIWTYGMRTLR